VQYFFIELYKRGNRIGAYRLTVLKCTVGLQLFYRAGRPHAKIGLTLSINV